MIIIQYQFRVYFFKVSSLESNILHYFFWSLSHLFRQRFEKKRRIIVCSMFHFATYQSFTQWVYFHQSVNGIRSSSNHSLATLCRLAVRHKSNKKCRLGKKFSKNLLKSNRKSMKKNYQNTEQQHEVFTTTQIASDKAIQFLIRFWGSLEYSVCLFFGVFIDINNNIFQNCLWSMINQFLCITFNC